MRIDLHTHLLPGIDDGAGSVEEAMELIELLSEQRIQIAVCTPHFEPYMTALSDFLKERQAAMDLMSDAGIRLIAGSETSLHDYLFHYPELSALCITDTRYLLLEMPFTKHWKSKIYEQLNMLINYYNIIPILAHIERYPAIKRKDRTVRRLIELGCVLQLNTSSLLNKRTRRRAIRYLKRGYISVLGSDCHNMKDRRPRISVPLDIIATKIGTNTVNTLIHNAERIINNELIE